MNVKSIKTPIFCICIILMMSIVNAQGTWKVYTKDDGLKSNNISEIFKDSEGNLWFNTSEAVKKGVMKFDGKDWTSYYNKNSLASITTFFEDSKGTLWLGVYIPGTMYVNGLTKVNGDSFERISKVGTKFIAEGSDGRLWFGAKNLLSYDGNSIIEHDKKEFWDGKIAALYCNNSGNIWVGTESGVASYDGKNWKVYSNVANCPTNSVNSIISDNQGNFWFGGEDGVYKYDGNNWQHFNKKDGLVGTPTLYIRIDSHDNVYAIAGIPEKENVGIVHAIKLDVANDGLSIFENGQWRPFNEREGVPYGLRSVFCEDKSGNLWFNSKDDAIYKFDGSSKTLFNESNGFIGKYFGAMLEDSRGNYWFITAAGIAKFDGENWSYFNKDTGLPSNLIYSTIIEDNNGDIWFGSWKGVLKYTYE